MTKKMKSKVVWKGGLSFTGTSDNGFMIPLDTDKALGGHEMGFKPLQLIAIGLVGCTGMDVMSILLKKRQEITDFDVEARIERADTHPRVFEKIIITYAVTGRNINADAVKRAVELSETKYCPAHAMLEKSVEISHEILINNID